MRPPAKSASEVSALADAAAERSRPSYLSEKTAAAEREELISTLADALTLLSGWIERHCPPKYRAEHRADLEEKLAVLAKAQAAAFPK